MSAFTMDVSPATNNKAHCQNCGRRLTKGRPRLDVKYRFMHGYFCLECIFKDYRKMLEMDPKSGSVFEL